MQLTPEQLAAWKREGTLVVPDVFPQAATASALEEIERNAYDGLTYTEYRTKWDPQPDALKSAYEKNSDMQRLAGPFGKALHFPTGLEAVDKLLFRTEPSSGRGWAIIFIGRTMPIGVIAPTR